MKPIPALPARRALQSVATRLAGFAAGAALLLAVWIGWREDCEEAGRQANISTDDRVALTREAIVIPNREARVDSEIEPESLSSTATQNQATARSSADPAAVTAEYAASPQQLSTAALADADPLVREDAVLALGEVGDHAALQTLEQALADSDAEVQHAAVAALTDIGGDESALALSSALYAADPALRAEAVDALGEIGGRVSVRLLKQALADEEGAIREAAADYLAELERIDMTRIGSVGPAAE